MVDIFAQENIQPKKDIFALEGITPFTGVQPLTQAPQEVQDEVAKQQTEYEALAQSRYTPNQIQGIRDKGPIGFWEATKFLGREDILPGGGIAQAVESGLLLVIAKKLEKGEKLQPAQEKLLNEFIDETLEINLRGFSIRGSIMHGGAQMPAFITEFMMTGGIGKVGIEILEKVAKEKILKETSGRIAKGAVKATAFAAVAIPRTMATPTMWAPQYAERRLNDYMTITDKGQMILKESEESPAMSALKAFGYTYIELFSETAGPAITTLVIKPVAGVLKKPLKAAANKLPDALKRGLFQAYKTIKPNARVSEAFKAGGWNGMLEELGEERIAQIMTATFDLATEDMTFEEYLGALTPDVDQLLIEAGIISIMGGVKSSANITMNLLESRGMTRTEAQKIVNSMSSIETDDFVNENADVGAGISTELSEELEPSAEVDLFTTQFVQQILDTGRYNEVEAVAMSEIFRAAYQTEINTAESADIKNVVQDYFGGLSVQQGQAGGQTFFQTSPEAGLRSRLMDTTAGLQQLKGTGDQYLAQIRKTAGVKESEIAWTGLDEFLAGKKSVTKAEINEYLEQNQTVIEEVTLGGQDQAELRYLEQDMSMNEAASAAQGDVTKFESYTLPGGENYREMLITLPVPDTAENFTTVINQEETDYADEEMRDIIAPSGRVMATLPADEVGEYIRNENIQGRTSSPVFKSPHYPQLNILAHVRLNDRVDSEGNRVLFIEEIQSDWHQEGRKEGYAVTETLYEVYNPKGGLERTVRSSEAAQSVIDNRRFPDLDSAEDWAVTPIESKVGVPDAPFKKTWHEMTFRRVVQMAANQGYDAVAWTTGEQQNERFDLSKQISILDYKKSASQLIATNHEGEVVIKEHNVTPEKLEDYVGKDVAKRLIEEGKQEDSIAGHYRLEGQDLKVGGEGMKGFYDKILPSYAKKFGKKFGSKVGTTEISEEESTGYLSYEGKSPTLSQVQEVRDAAKGTAPNLISPITGKKMEFTLTRVVVEQPMIKILKAMEDGAEFEDVFNKEGTEEIAEIFGGTASYEQVETPYEVWTLPVTDKMRETAQGGFELFQSEDNLIRRPLSLRGFVRKNGGINDVDGDLKAMDLHKDSRFSGVVRKSGKSPDEMRELAEEAGYLQPDSADETTTTKHLYDALSQEMSGNSVYSVEDQSIVDEYESRLQAKEESDQYNALVDEILQEAEELGIELSEKDTEIIALLTTEGYDIEDATEIHLTRDGQNVETDTSEREGQTPVQESDDIPFDGIEPSETRPRGKQGDQEPTGFERGSIAFDGSASVISAFEQADISTILHEGGHFFLELQRVLSEHPDASGTRKQRWSDMLDWLGVEDGSQITTEHHEKFAEGFERYIAEGKAPSASMRDTFRKFRTWLSELWSRLPQLKPDLQLTPEVRNFFDHLLATEQEIADGTKFDKSYSTLEVARMSPEEREEIKQAKLKDATNKKHKENIKRKYGEKPEYELIKKRGLVGEGKDALADFGKMVERAMTPISTRLKHINIKLKYKLRRFEFRMNRRVQADQAALIPFLKKYKKMDDSDKALLDYAMKNGDINMVDDIAREHDMVEEIATVRKTLEAIYARAEAVGYELGYRENFFPRHVIDAEGLVNFFEESEAWGEINQALAEKANELGRVLTTEEKAHMINTLLRGYKTSAITLAKPGALKERNIDQVTPEINEFYNTTDQALIRYFSIVNEAIEARKFFGKKVKTRLTVDSEDKIAQTKDMEDSIGYFVLNEIEKGTITPAQAKELTEILQARFNRGQMGAFWRLYKNLSYIDTMGSVTSAITQIGDLSYAMYNAGFFGTMRVLPRAIIGKSKLTKEDIGIDRIAQEFDDSSRSGKAVMRVFKLIGLNKMDNIGKETLINGVHNKFKKLAKKPSDAFRQQLELIFEGETDQVISDLQNDITSENVKLLLFNELLDFQPVALSEMPEAYLKMKNGKIFYMLKSFTVKQLDIYRNEVYDEINSGNPVKGMRNLIRLVGFFVMMNAGADVLKSILLGRELELDDLIISNILRLFGISKFQFYTSKREGIGSAAFKAIAPPFKLIDSATKDIARAIDRGEISIDEMQSIKSVPLVGKLYYYWFGAGA